MLFEVLRAPSVLMGFTLLLSGGLASHRLDPAKRSPTSKATPIDVYGRGGRDPISWTGDESFRSLVLD